MLTCLNIWHHYSFANHFYSSDEVLNGLFQAGFGDFESVQTVFGDISKISSEQDFRKGYGEGDFVVIRGFKRSD